MKKSLIVLLAVLLLAAGCVRIETKPEIAQPTETAAAPESTPTAEPQETPAQEPAANGTPEPNCFDALIGDWTIVSVILDGEMLDPASVGMDSTVSFFGNGAGIIRAQSGDEEEEQIFTFSVSENRIEMFDEENTRTEAVYEPETDTILWKADMIVSLVLARKTDSQKPAPEPAEEDIDYTTAEIERFSDDNGSDMVTITVPVPAHGKVRIVFQHQDDYFYENTEDKPMKRKVRIPVEIFYPNMPVPPGDYECIPEIIVTFADGTEQPVACPPISLTFPQLSIKGMPDEYMQDYGIYHVKANADGVFTFEGTVDGEDVAVYVDGVPVQVYYGGVFTAELTVENGEPTLREIRAERMNWMTDVLLVIVEPCT